MKKFILFLTVLCCVASFSAAANAEQTESNAEYKTFEELNGKTISLVTGVPFKDLIASFVSNAKEYTYYQTMPDIILALKTRKIDAGFTSDTIARFLANRDPELAVFPKNLGYTPLGFGFVKGDKRRDEWQAAFDKIPEENKRAIYLKWIGADESIKQVPEQNWPGKNGTIRIATVDSFEPMSYVGKGGKLFGYDIEIVLLIAKELDVHVEFTPMDLPAELSALASGKADMICGSIVITPERRKAMDFVEYHKAAYVLIVRSTEKTAAVSSFWDGIKESIEKTFIQDERYKSFIEGIKTTLIITVLAILFGTLLGFVVFWFCKDGNKFANTISGFFIWLIQGMPVVVLLMILYYIIFAKVALSSTAIAVVAFTLVFGGGVFGMLRLGVGAIDKGQTEAALALGYSDVRLFFRVILPQAIPLIIPTYKAECVALLKATAIVGYIAVQDLTKIGDIIRARTYEAFFPLIAVAVVYFILGGLFTFIIRIIETGINPRKRKKENILKEVLGND